jgi:hypothetical protein
LNHNRLHLRGAEPGLKVDGITRLITRFSDAGIARYFVWVSPGPPERVRVIAQRIKKAVAAGCKIVVSEALSILQHSLGNSQQLGFEVVYESEVYGLFTDNEPKATSRHAT